MFARDARDARTCKCKCKRKRGKKICKKCTENTLVLIRIFAKRFVSLMGVGLAGKTSPNPLKGIRQSAGQYKAKLCIRCKDSKKRKSNLAL